MNTNQTTFIDTADLNKIMNRARNERSKAFYAIAAAVRRRITG